MPSNESLKSPVKDTFDNNLKETNIILGNISRYENMCKILYVLKVKELSGQYRCWWCLFPFPWGGKLHKLQKQT